MYSVFEGKLVLWLVWLPNSFFIRCRHFIYFSSQWLVFWWDWVAWRCLLQGNTIFNIFFLKRKNSLKNKKIMKSKNICLNIIFLGRNSLFVKTQTACSSSSKTVTQKQFYSFIFSNYFHKPPSKSNLIVAYSTAIQALPKISCSLHGIFCGNLYTITKNTLNSPKK